MFRRICFLVLLTGVATGAAGQTRFTDVTHDLGLEYRYTGLNLGGGSAWVDVDGDRDLDLIISCGVECTNELFRNDGSAGFARIPIGRPQTGFEESKAVVLCDLDEDGDPELLTTARNGPCRYLRNDPDRFVERTVYTGISGIGQYYGLAFADYDRDGDLDFFVANHGLPKALYRNDGGTFTNVAADLGVEYPGGLGFQCVWFDYDNDGDPDIYLANDKGHINHWPNVLYRNNGDGTFTDVSQSSGAGLAGELMGLAIGDYDNDGFLDFYTTNTPIMEAGGNFLGHNNGDGTFTEVAMQLGVAVDEVCWGANFFDADNDGDLDLFVCAMNLDNTNRLFWNNGNGTFTDGTFGSGIEDFDASFGSSVGDYDADGDLDLHVSNSTGTARLYRNDGVLGHWLKLRLRGTESNRDAIGARVTARDGARSQIREVNAGTSFLSQDSREVHFGFGSTTVVDEVEIRWPSGLVQTLRSIPTDQTLDLVEPRSSRLAAAMAGNVNAGAGPVVNVLFANGSAGDALREIWIDRDTHTWLTLVNAPSLPSSRYIAYGWVGVPRLPSVTDVGFGVGDVVMPTPLTGARPLHIWNTIGFGANAGRGDRPALPAPTTFVDEATGYPRGFTVTVQAILEDAAAANVRGLSISNAIIVHVR